MLVLSFFFIRYFFTQEVEYVANRVRDDAPTIGLHQIKKTHWVSLACSSVSIHKNEPVVFIVISVGLSHDMVDYVLAANVKYFLGSLFAVEDMIEFVDSMLQSSLDLYFILTDVLDLLWSFYLIELRFELDKDLLRRSVTLSLFGWWTVWCRVGVSLRSYSMCWDRLWGRWMGDSWALRYITNIINYLLLYGQHLWRPISQISWSYTLQR